MTKKAKKNYTLEDSLKKLRKYGSFIIEMNVDADGLASDFYWSTFNGPYGGLINMEEDRGHSIQDCINQMYKTLKSHESINQMYKILKSHEYKKIKKTKVKTKK